MDVIRYLADLSVGCHQRDDARTEGLAWRERIVAAVDVDVATSVDDNLVPAFGQVAQVSVRCLRAIAPLTYEAGLGPGHDQQIAVRQPVEAERHAAGGLRHHLHPTVVIEGDDLA